MNLNKEKIISSGLEELDSDDEKSRNRGYNTLLPISEEHPEDLYHHWDRLVGILRKERVSNKFMAIHLLANLARIDRENKFDRIFDEFYDLIRHESPVVSPHIAGKSGKIINAKPHLQKAIVERLLTTDEKSQCRHKELLKSYVIDALDESYSKIDNQDLVLQYVENQLKSSSPKTRKRARHFLEKHGRPSQTG